MFKAHIYVMYKPSIVDPQAVQIQTTLKRMGENGVRELAAGKYFEVTVAAADRTAAEEQINRICDQLLTNVNLEQYRFDLTEIVEAHG